MCWKSIKTHCTTVKTADKIIQLFLLKIAVSGQYKCLTPSKLDVCNKKNKKMLVIPCTLFIT